MEEPPSSTGPVATSPPSSTTIDAQNSTTQSPQKVQHPRPPSLRTGVESQTAANMTQSSTPLGNINAARRPGVPPNSASSALPQTVQDKMRAFHLSRQKSPPSQPVGGFASGERSVSSSHVPPTAKPASNGGLLSGRSPGVASPGVPIAADLAGSPPPAVNRPAPVNLSSAPVIPNTNRGAKNGLAAKRGLNMGMKLSDASGPPAASQEKTADTKKSGLPQTGSVVGGSGSLFNKYTEYVDTKAGTLNFKGKATVHGRGIDFSSGSSFSISLDEVDTLDELGKGNYGTVYKVRHSRPRIRKPGQGLSGNRAPSSLAPSKVASDEAQYAASTPSANAGNATTGVIMAMKEIRLELDDAKFAAIIMELDILHRCLSPFIVDFYGAFFQEGAVYICMEFMDGGSIDKLYGDGVPEAVLRKITLATVMGLKALKEDYNIIHRDVKPTNILINTKGHVKICDFGVSGNLVASIAKTNIGCQSYMAPERISGGGVAQAGANPGGGTYSVQSDIWSLGLTIIECGMGQYPYPPETYDNIFSQLSAIVDGDPPDLPAEHFSESARDFVRGALNKIPKLRPTYAMLLRHPWLSTMLKPPTIEEEDEEAAEQALSEEVGVQGVVDCEISRWVLDALGRKRTGNEGKKHKAPALHAAPLSPS